MTTFSSRYWLSGINLEVLHPVSSTAKSDIIIMWFFIIKELKELKKLKGLKTIDRIIDSLFFAKKHSPLTPLISQIDS